MADKSLDSVLREFFEGNCFIADAADFFNKGMLEGRMTRPVTSFLLLIALVTVFINFGVIFRICKLLKKGQEVKPPFFFIGNLAISDFLVGLYVIVVFCVDLSQSTSAWKNRCCGFLTATVVTACQETIFTITLIAIDKYIFICHGLTYRVKVTRRRVYFVIAASWCFSLLIGSLPALGMHERGWCSCNFLLYISRGFAVVLFLTTVVIPLTIIISLYTIILSLAIKMTKSRLKGTRSNSSGVSTTVMRLSFSSKSSKLASRSTSKASNASGISRATTARASQASNTRTLVSKNPFGPSPSNSKATTRYHRRSKRDSINVEDNAGPRVASREHELVRDSLETSEEVEAVASISNLSEEGRAVAPTIATSDDETEVDVDAVKHSALQTMKPRAEERGLLSNKTFKTENAVKVHNANLQTADDRDGSSSDRSSSRKNWRPLTYFKKIISESKDKVQFLQKCKAIKAIALIVLLFIVTYVPFVIGTFAYKLKKEPDERLFKALNNLLYCAVVFNSLINPFIYAYGCREFRLKTKQFKRCCAKDNSI